MWYVVCVDACPSSVRLTKTQILLLVYVIYLLFQLKSHAYMYESMPQYLIDEEATPGPAPTLEEWTARPALVPRLASADVSEEAVEDEGTGRARKRHHKHSIRRHRKQKKKSSHLGSSDMVAGEGAIRVKPVSLGKAASNGEPRRVDFAFSDAVPMVEGSADGPLSRKPFNIRGM